MFVKSVMIPKHKMISVQKGVSVREAAGLLSKHAIDGLPVLDGSRYVGLVTKNAIYEAAFHTDQSKDDFMDSTTVGEIAIKSDNTVDETEVFEETLIKVQDVPLIAVVDDGHECTGIVTRFDVIEQFRSAFGMNKKGVRIVFSSVDTEGRILRLSEITQQFHLNIISLTTFDDTDKLIRRIVIKVIENSDTERFIQKMEKNGFKVISVKRTE
ncbi:CBS domain-containing protein [Camelliibacillus cellulosilyticus]|uniref:CBS domain-containing protein n=1 Tax=Camelliibacillus cellulosilyticus TaxID=2174486 RepID=A0ABV9GIL1_9BACL